MILAFGYHTTAAIAVVSVLGNFILVAMVFAAFTTMKEKDKRHSDSMHDAWAYLRERDRPPEPSDIPEFPSLMNRVDDL